MAYKVIVMFRDLQDNGHTYRPGDVFPRDGVAATPERVAELSGSDNMRGRPLIVAEKKPTRKRVKKDD